METFPDSWCDSETWHQQSPIDVDPYTTTPWDQGENYYGDSLGGLYENGDISTDGI